MNSSTEHICCEQMRRVLSISDYYENDKLIIVRSRNSDTGVYNYMCHDKENNDTLPLGACIFCGKELS